MRFPGRTAFVVAIAASLAGWMGYQRGYVKAVAAAPAEKGISVRERRPHPVDARVEGREKLRKLLGRPVNARTSAEAWAVISGYSVGQIKDALEDLPRGEPHEAAGNQEAMLYFCWAQIDPLQALAAAGKVAAADKQKRWPAFFAFTAWMKDDPDNAYQWAMDSPAFDQNVAHRQMARLLTAMPPDDG